MVFLVHFNDLTWKCRLTQSEILLKCKCFVLFLFNLGASRSKHSNRFLFLFCTMLDIKFYSFDLHLVLLFKNSSNCSISPLSETPSSPSILFLMREIILAHCHVFPLHTRYPEFGKKRFPLQCSHCQKFGSKGRTRVRVASLIAAESIGSPSIIFEYH